MFDQLILLLSWLLLPVAVITLVDDWFLRPSRRLAALPAPAVDPGWLRGLYAALPVLVVAGAVRLFRSERLDFSLVLVLISVIGGAIWLLDAWLLRPARERAARARQHEAEARQRAADRRRKDAEEKARAAERAERARAHEAKVADALERAAQRERQEAEKARERAARASQAR